MEIVRYKYKIELLYEYNGSLVSIDGDQIQNVLIDFDYDNKNMPIMFIKLSIDKKLLDDMITNSTTKTITVYINKYILDSPINIEESYIKEDMIYFLDDNVNDKSDIDYNGSTQDNKDMFKTTTIGLMKQSLIDNNKVITNGYFNTNRNTLLSSVLSYNSKLLIEKSSNTNRENMYIPVIDSVSKFIRYFNDNYGIYDTPYRLFYDYDCTYLLSSSGDFIEKNNDSYGTIIINIHKVLTQDSKVQGMTIDKDNSSYILDVDVTSLSSYEDKTTIKSYDTIIGVDSNGNTKKVQLNMPGNSNSTNSKIMKVNSLDQIDRYKASIEANTFVLSFDKNDIDTSIFTLNKKYLIKQDEKESKYILTQKKEIYTRENKDYMLTVIFSFKKVDE